jgi:hypothetical protein
MPYGATPSRQRVELLSPSDEHFACRIGDAWFVKSFGRRPEAPGFDDGVSDATLPAQLRLLALTAASRFDAPSLDYLPRIGNSAGKPSGRAC